MHLRCNRNIPATHQRPVALCLTFQRGSSANQGVTHTRSVAGADKQLVLSGWLEVLQYSLGGISLHSYLFPVAPLGRLVEDAVLEDVPSGGLPGQLHCGNGLIKHAKVARSTED